MLSRFHRRSSTHRDIFEHENRQVLKRPGVRLLVGDGRSHLRLRLRPAGVFCQWAHTYEIAERDLQSIVHTFGSVFPYGTMWLVGDGDLLLIGTAEDDMESRVARTAERSRKGSVPALIADVAVAQSVAPFVLLSLFGPPGGSV